MSDALCTCAGCGNAIRDEANVFCVRPPSGSSCSTSGATSGYSGSSSCVSSGQQSTSTAASCATSGASLGDTGEAELCARVVEQRGGEQCVGVGDRNRAAAPLQQSGAGVGSYWHERCLRCAECSCALADQSRCFTRDRRLLCPQDYLRSLVVRCARCERQIAAQDWVRRAERALYHLACFACDACKRQLSTGERFGVLGGRVLCAIHYADMLELLDRANAASPSGDGASELGGLGVGVGSAGAGGAGAGGARSLHLSSLTLSRKSCKPKRIRTTFSEEQLAVLQQHFARDSNPDSQDLERIALETGLSKRVTQVWFQNSRAREKKRRSKRSSDSGGERGQGAASPLGGRAPSETDTLMSSSGSDSNGLSPAAPCGGARTRCSALCSPSSSSASASSSLIGATGGNGGGGGGETGRTCARAMQSPTTPAPIASHQQQRPQHPLLDFSFPPPAPPPLQLQLPLPSMSVALGGAASACASSTSDKSPNVEPFGAAAGAFAIGRNAAAPNSCEFALQQSFPFGPGPHALPAAAGASVMHSPYDFPSPRSSFPEPLPIFNLQSVV